MAGAGELNLQFGDAIAFSGDDRIGGNNNIGLLGEVAKAAQADAIDIIHSGEIDRDISFFAGFGVGGMVIGGGDVEGDGHVIVQAFNAGIVRHKDVLACGAVEVQRAVAVAGATGDVGAFQGLVVADAIEHQWIAGLIKPIHQAEAQIRAVGFPVPGADGAGLIAEAVISACVGVIQRGVIHLGFPVSAADGVAVAWAITAELIGTRCTGVVEIGINDADHEALGAIGGIQLKAGPMHHAAIGTAAAIIGHQHLAVGIFGIA